MIAASPISDRRKAAQKNPSRPFLSGSRDRRSSQEPGCPPALPTD